LAAGLVSKVMLNRNELSTQFATATKNLAAYNIKTIGTYNINRSRDALRLINNIRWAYYSECKYLQSKGKNAAALKLIQGMEEKLDTKILPYEHPPLEGAFDELKEALSAVK
jgi:hypothetical protein